MHVGVVSRVKAPGAKLEGMPNSEEGALGRMRGFCPRFICQSLHWLHHNSSWSVGSPSCARYCCCSG